MFHSSMSSSQKGEKGKNEGGEKCASSLNPFEIASVQGGGDCNSGNECNNDCLFLCLYLCDQKHQPVIRTQIPDICRTVSY